MATVWIANDGGHPDYHKSRKIAGTDAEIKHLTDGNVNYHRVDRLIQHLSRGIARFVKEEDYLLQSGSLTVNSLAFELWLRQFGSCNLLIWHGGKREYTLHVIKDSHLDQQLEKAIAPGIY